MASAGKARERCWRRMLGRVNYSFCLAIYVLYLSRNNITLFKLRCQNFLEGRYELPKMASLRFSHGGGCRKRAGSAVWAFPFFFSPLPITQHPSLLTSSSTSPPRTFLPFVPLTHPTSVTNMFTTLITATLVSVFAAIQGAQADISVSTPTISQVRTKQRGCLLCEKIVTEELFASAVMFTLAGRSRLARITLLLFLLKILAMTSCK